MPSSISLVGAIVAQNRVEATYRFTAFRAEKTARKDDKWPQAVLDAGTDLLAAAQAEAAGLGTVVQVQIYTSISDPQGYPGFSQPGELLDVTFQPGNSPQQVRVGDDETVPTSMAAARDALKAAIVAALG